MSIKQLDEEYKRTGRTVIARMGQHRGYGQL